MTSERVPFPAPLKSGVSLGTCQERGQTTQLNPDGSREASVSGLLLSKAATDSKRHRGKGGPGRQLSSPLCLGAGPAPGAPGLPTPPPAASPQQLAPLTGLPDPSVTCAPGSEFASPTALSLTIPPQPEPASPGLTLRGPSFQPAHHGTKPHTPLTTATEAFPVEQNQLKSKTFMLPSGAHPEKPHKQVGGPDQRLSGWTHARIAWRIYSSAPTLGFPGQRVLGGT